MPTPVDKELRRAIAARLKHARARLNGGYTSTAMAREMGFTPQRWHNYENGQRPFELPTLIRFCEDYGLSLDYMLKGNRTGMTPEVLTMLAVEPEPVPAFGIPKPRKKKPGKKRRSAPR
jgi:transcriptional regulator with XRE-family HTH domain